MSQKIAVVACSNACLDYFDYDYDIPIFRSTLHLGDEDYLDYVDIKADDFYKRLEDDKSVFPSSSYMPLGQMIEIYEKLEEDGFTDVIVISISKEMSGIYNAAQIASKNLNTMKVHVFDSKTVAYPEAKMALRAAEMAKAGKSVEAILNELAYIRDNNKIYFAVNTLTYLVKNGRLSNASGFIGNTLKIKPVLTISEDGKVETVEKIRTFKKATNRLIELFENETRGKDIEPFIIHANNPEMVEYLTNEILRVHPNLKEVFSMPLTAVVGAHAGPKTVGVGYYIKQK